MRRTRGTPWVPRHSWTTAASSAGATWRTPRTACPSARRAGSSRPCTRAAADVLSRSPAWTVAAARVQGRDEPALRAEGHAVRGVLHVAPDDDAAVVHECRGTHGVPRVRRIGTGHRLARGIAQPCPVDLGVGHGTHGFTPTNPQARCDAPGLRDEW